VASVAKPLAGGRVQIQKNWLALAHVFSSSRRNGARCGLAILLIIHDGKLVTQGTMAELRTGSETLEDVFVRVVGADHPSETLDWL
jgi:hypothetical protein